MYIFICTYIFVLMIVRVHIVPILGPPTLPQGDLEGFGVECIQAALGPTDDNAGLGPALVHIERNIATRNRTTQNECNQGLCGASLGLVRAVPGTGCSIIDWAASVPKEALRF